MSLTPKADNGNGRPPVFPYKIGHSALFPVGSHLSLTPASVGNRKTWTLHFRIKKTQGTAGTDIPILWAWNAPAFSAVFYHSTDHSLRVLESDGAGGQPYSVLTNGINTDPTGWTDWVIQYDSTKETATDRITVHRDLSPISFQAGATYPAQDFEGVFNSDTPHYLAGGTWNGTITMYGDCYLADVQFIDGETAAPEVFSDRSPLVTGLIVPKGGRNINFGGNGYDLLFKNAADLGHDSSGNGNHWSVSGSPVQTLDTPTNNHPTLNPLDADPAVTLSNGNLTAAEEGTATNKIVRSTRSIPCSGNWYWEVKNDATGDSCTPTIGIARPSETLSSYLGQSSDSYGIGSCGDFLPGASALTPFASGAVLGFRFDADNGDLYVGLVSDGKIAWMNGGSPAASAIPPGDWLPAVSLYSGAQVTFEFGAQSFAIDTLPSGCHSLAAENLPEPSVQRSSEVADIVMRTGTETATSVSSLAFSPDFVLIKKHDGTTNWNVFDTERGAKNWLATNMPEANTASTDRLMSFDSNGYSLGADAAQQVNNTASQNFLDLCLKAGREQGFQIITYEGTGTAHDVEHLLGSPPAFILVKQADVLKNWAVFHHALGGGVALELNTSGAAVVSSAYWDDTLPGSTTFRVGPGDNTNETGGEYIAYLFADSDLFKTFSYIGNGSQDGPFVHLGGRPLAIWTKNSDATDNWRFFDARRAPCNPIDMEIYPNTAAAEAPTGTPVYQFTSQGFKTVASDGGYNGTGQRIVGLAIMESAAQYANAY